MPAAEVPAAEVFAGRTSTLRPEPGQLVVFPSFLMHWVWPNQSDEDRIVIAWNLDIVERDAASDLQ